MKVQVKKSNFDARDYKIIAGEDFPDVFELPKCPVKNQGTKPTCTAHAGAALIERHNLKETGEYTLFSTEFIYGTREDGDDTDGMSIRNALKVLKTYGDPRYVDCPGNHRVRAATGAIQDRFDEYCELAYPYRIQAYYRVKTVNEIKTALMSHGAVIFSYESKQNSKLINGIYTYDERDAGGQHCALIVGWNKDGWIVQNSWGACYGNGGYFTLPYTYKLTDAFGTVDMQNDMSLISKKKRGSIRDCWYLFINAVVNFVYRVFYENTQD